MEKMWLVVQGKTNGFLPSWRRCVMLKNGVQFPCPVLYCNGLVLSTNESEMQKKQGVRELEYKRGFLTGNTNLSETELFIRLVPRMWTLHPLGIKSVRTPAKPHPKIEQALSAKTSRPAISLEYHFLYNSPNKKIGFGVKPKYCNKDWKPTLQAHSTRESALKKLSWLRRYTRHVQKKRICGYVVNLHWMERKNQLHQQLVSS